MSNKHPIRKKLKIALEECNELREFEYNREF